VLAPADPVHDTPGDDLAVGKGTIERNAKAILPSIARFTRVCAYDRPDIRVTGADLSTPRQQPHTADLGVGDLHALLAALGDPGPYVLVAHSYGGLIAELYARTYPRDVAGLAMVDTVTPRIEDVASLAKLANWDAHNAATSPRCEKACGSSTRSSRSTRLPRCRRCRPSSCTRTSRGRSRPASDRPRRRARHQDQQRSGDVPVLPALVIDAVREVVDDARAAELIHAASRDPRYCQALQPRLAALVS
jgi:pimeloyl-ACP methyl ester carboxylesterase